MFDLGLGQVAQQLADAGVGAVAGCFGIEAAGVPFHLPCHAPHRIDSEGPDLLSFWKPFVICAMVALLIHLLGRWTLEAMSA